MWSKVVDWNANIHPIQTNKRRIKGKRHKEVSAPLK